MADDNPNLPGGAVPPGSKVQPKKETVRINLPPKPSAAPTIKLPTLPPGGPGVRPQCQRLPRLLWLPRPPLPATGAAPIASAPAQRPVQRQMPVIVSGISGLDKGLAIGAAVAALVAIGSTVYCLMLFTPS